MNRRSFIQYLSGIAALIGFPVNGRAIQGPIIQETKSPISDPVSHPLSEAPRGVPKRMITKVVGVGGPGGHAVEHMIREGVQNVEFIYIDTDLEALNRSSAGTKLLIGPGFGAGGRPDRARSLALPERVRIADVLRGTDIVFITAGMGGGTGTGVAPIVAEVAREQGILSVAVVTKPFKYEGRRMALAENGLTEVERHADSVIVLSNEKLMEVLDENVTMSDAFHTMHNVQKNAVNGIAEIINVPGLVVVDFEDVRTIMADTGKAMMGSATAAGADRARIAAVQAIASPFIEGDSPYSARGILVNITANSFLGMKEVREVMKIIGTHAAKDATIILGIIREESMEELLRVTVVATRLIVNGVPIQSSPVMAHSNQIWQESHSQTIASAMVLRFPSGIEA